MERLENRSDPTHEPSAHAGLSIDREIKNRERLSHRPVRIEIKFNPFVEGKKKKREEEGGMEARESRAIELARRPRVLAFAEHRARRN